MSVTRRTKFIGCLSGGFVLLVSVGIAVRGSFVLAERLRPSELEDAKPPVVEVIRLAPEPFEHIVPVAGSLAPIHDVDVFAKEGGKVVAVHVKLGDRVRRGDPLASLEAKERGLQARQAEVGLSMAEQGAEVAQNSLDRLDRVYDQLGDGAMAKSDYETARVQAEGALVQRDLARLQRDLARQVADNAVLRAPVDGVISKVYAREGGMVGHEYPSFHIANTESLVLRAEVADTDVSQVHPGQRVRMAADALPDVALEGTVTAVSPSLDAITRRAPIEVAFDNPGGIVVGNLFARGQIVVRSEDTALVLPLEVVQRTGDGASVQVVRDGKLATRPVEVLGENAGLLAIGGLGQGELVLVPGPGQLADGQAVDAVERGAAGDGIAAGGPTDEAPPADTDAAGAQ